MEYLISKLALETTLSLAETEKKEAYWKLCCLNHAKYISTIKKVQKCYLT